MLGGAAPLCASTGLASQSTSRPAAGVYWFMQAALAGLWVFNYGAVMAWMPWLYRWYDCCAFPCKDFLAKLPLHTFSQLKLMQCLPTWIGYLLIHAKPSRGRARQLAKKESENAVNMAE